jgi:hypothetical protein
MIDYTCTRYVALCKVYDGMSKSFYQQYQDACSKFEEIDRLNPDLKEENMMVYCDSYGLKQSSAIAAVVFQALAIEALINLFGVFLLGDEKYYNEYENKRNRFSTPEKLKKLFKNELNKPYPTQTGHYLAMKTLLDKRDKLVHVKPRAVEITSRQDDLQQFMDRLKDEIGFVYKGLDAEMQSYETVKLELLEANPKFENWLNP